MNIRLSFFTLPCCGLLLSACAPNDPSAESAPPSRPSTGTKVSFVKDIKPILSNKCTICHNSEVLPKRPNFEVGERALQSGVIVPGNPGASRILKVIQEEHGAAMAMPPVSHRLTSKEIALLRQWIAEGASWPAGPSGRVKPAFIPKE